MKSTGIVRKLDQLGRVVLPIELRRVYNICADDPMEMYIEGDMIILKKYAPTCIFCGESKSMGMFKDKLICTDCKDELKTK